MMITTLYGKKPIKDIMINDTVISYNEKSDIFEYKIVYDLFKNHYTGNLIQITLENGRIIKCTPNHKFLTNHEWIRADELTEYHELIEYHELLMKISSITSIEYIGYVYNFSVEDNHNYLVEDVIVSNCHYCYTDAKKTGLNFENIIEKANLVWGSLNLEDRPFQIAIGGAGESTMHPDWIPFVKEVKALGIMPNYTTNGMHLSNDILKATGDYCGGVAISYHPHIQKIFHKSIEKFSTIKTKLNVHLIIGDEQSLIDCQNIYNLYYDKIDYFVLLPYQAHGRGKHIETKLVWDKLFKWINTVNSKKFAFGALFYEYFTTNKTDLNMSIYEPEIYSGYRMMDDSYSILRKSSYDLRQKLIN
jgi:hypothetical protein